MNAQDTPFFFLGVSFVLNVIFVALYRRERRLRRKADASNVALEGQIQLLKEMLETDTRQLQFSTKGGSSWGWIILIIIAIILAIQFGWIQ